MNEKTKTNSIDKMMQLLRTLKTAQVRKQLERDLTVPARYWDDKRDEHVPRTTIISDFLNDAKEQS